MGGAGRQHDQTVEAECDTARRRHVGERPQKVLVDRITLAVDTVLLIHVGGEATALLGRLGQFGEAVGEFDPAGIELEALRETRIRRLHPRQRRLACRIFGEERGAADPEIGLDLFREHTAENIRPGIVRGDTGSGRRGSGGEAVAILEQIVKIDAGVAGKGLGNRQALGLSIRIGGVTAPAKGVGAGRLGRRPEESGAVEHDGLIGFSGAIPLDHGELRRVQGASFAIAEDAGKVDDLLLAGGEQLLHGELGRGVEVALHLRPVRTDPFGGEGVKVGFVARRYLQGGSLDLDKSVVREPTAKRREDAIAGEQKRPPVVVAFPFPEPRFRHRTFPTP